MRAKMLAAVGVAAGTAFGSGAAWPQALQPAPGVSTAGAEALLMDGGRVLNVRSGMQVMVQIDKDGVMSTPVVRVIDRATMKPMPGAGVETSWEAPGSLVFSLGGSRQTGSILSIQNNTDRHLAYKGGIFLISSGKVISRSTTVCSLLPHTTGYEKWPEPVVQVTVGGFEDQSGQAPSCK